MRRFRILISATARRQLREIAGWWKENRPAEPDLFLDQLEASLQRLSTLPGSGSPYLLECPANLRRVLLPRCPYHLYYTVDEDAGTVTIRAVWHTARGHGPPLT